MNRTTKCFCKKMIPRVSRAKKVAAAIEKYHAMNCLPD